MARGAVPVLAMLAAAAVPGGTAQAQVQAPGCRLPERIAPARPVVPPPGQARRTARTGYLLALGWSPEYCRAPGRADSLQCSGALGRFGFILHGLWPEGEGGDPRWCRRVPPPDPATVRATLCATPSVGLIAREWAKHGSCITRTPAAYFAAARRLHAAVRIPDMATLSRGSVTAGDLRHAFAAANPGLSAGAVAIDRNRRGWLEEVRLCLDLGFRPAACRRDQRGAPDDAPVAIWRG